MTHATRIIGAVGAILFWLQPVTAQDAGDVPLPPVKDEARAQEDETGLAGARPPERPDEIEGEPADADIEDLVTGDPPGDEAPTCRGRLEAMGVVFETLDAIAGRGGCGLARPLKVTAIGEIALQGPATVNCATAEALATLVTDHVVPAAEKHLEETPNAIAIGSSYVCRTRNSRPGAKLSEHATGNGVDIMSFGFPERDSVAVAAMDADLPEFRFLADVRASACELFTTVLGPGSDAAHANHFHVDLRQRKNDYRLCQ